MKPGRPVGTGYPTGTRPGSLRHRLESMKEGERLVVLDLQVGSVHRELSRSGLKGYSAKAGVLVLPRQQVVKAVLVIRK
jgi:hypothetical protein